MQIKVSIVKRDEEVPDADRQAIHVETHARRGDSFSVQRVDTMLEGSDEAVFNVPSGGRIVINTPLTHEEMVYDRDQMASVRLSQQKNPGNMAADKAVGTVPPGTVAPMPTPLPGQPQPDASRPQGMAPAGTTPAPAPANAETSGRRFKPENVVDTAKTQQQTSAGRPVGETPPAPGSSVGSPPSGNEGADKK